MFVIAILVEQYESGMKYDHLMTEDLACKLLYFFT